MKKLSFLLTCLSFFVFFSCGEDETDPIIPIETTKPNILLIISDDIGIDATPGYDVGAIKPNMPNLENLAAKGITFDNVWSNPLCAPTRATILTGRYGYHTGVLDVGTTNVLPSNEKILQAYLDEETNNAYNHAVIGKWHLSGNDPTQPQALGVGYYAGILGGGVGDYFTWNLTENETTNIFSGYASSKITDLSIDWINAQEDKPWFCWVAYNAAHTPFHLPPAEMHSQGDLPDDEASIEANPLPYYMAMKESLDFEMGRLIENIPTDELENTVIIYIGDNGTTGTVIQEPYTSNRAKGSLYQGGVHVPMIVSGQGVSRQGSRENQLVNSADLFATIADLAGVNISSYEDSFSFKASLSETNVGLRNYNYTEIYNEMPNRAGYAIRNNQYKLIEFESGQRRFYDLDNDPFETENLMNSTLTSIQSNELLDLEIEAARIRN